MESVQQKRKVLIITWLDAEDADSTWSTEKEAHEFGDRSLEVRSMGWELKRTKLYITIASDETSTGDFSTVRKIPLGMVLDIKEVDI